MVYLNFVQKRWGSTLNSVLAESPCIVIFVRLFLSPSMENWNSKIQKYWSFEWHLLAISCEKCFWTLEGVHKHKKGIIKNFQNMYDILQSYQCTFSIFLCVNAKSAQEKDVKSTCERSFLPVNFTYKVPKNAKSGGEHFAKIKFTDTSKDHGK